MENDFSLAVKNEAARKFFPPPKLPSGYIPSHTPVTFKSETMPKGLKELGERLNPVQRARLLGETYSVMSLIGSDVRKRLTVKTEAPLSKETKKSSVNRTETAFASDPVKRKRFQEYLSYLKRGEP